jgi:serine/threonine-protein kinase
VGALLGTPAYCAPEQRAGRELTPRADLYAVGVVLLELVTGQRPDPGDPTAALAGLRRGEPVAFASRFRKVLERGLAVDPQRRFATAAAMSEALRHSLDDRTTIELISGLEPCRTPPPLADGPASAPASSHPAGTAHPSDTALSALAVDVIEAKLAERIGPLARVLMRRHAAEAADKTDLVQRLAGHIRDSAARDGFLADLRQAVAVTPATGSGWPMTGMDAAGLDTPPPGAPPASARADSMGSGRVHKPVSQARAAQLEAHLAEHLGPVAKLLMRRALQKEPSEPELLEALCRHIPDPDAQAAFMAAARMG